MAKRFSQKAKKELIQNAVKAAIPILRLDHWQIEVHFDNGNEFRATCDASPRYQTAVLEFAPKRIRIFECVEFAVHELAHILTWRTAELLEQWAGDDPGKVEEAEVAYEYVTTQIGHIAVPRVVAELERRDQIPAEAKDVPNIIVHEKKPIRKLLRKEVLTTESETATL